MPEFEPVKLGHLTLPVVLTPDDETAKQRQADNRRGSLVRVTAVGNMHIATFLPEQGASFNGISKDGSPEAALAELVAVYDRVVVSASNGTTPIPDAVLAKIVGHAERHEGSGGFVTAVLENRPFVDVVAKADPWSFAALRSIAQFIHCRLPSPAWGSPEKVSAWRSMDRNDCNWCARGVPHLET